MPRFRADEAQRGLRDTLETLALQGGSERGCMSPFAICSRRQLIAARSGCCSRSAAGEEAWGLRPGNRRDRYVGGRALCCTPPLSLLMLFCRFAGVLWFRRGPVFSSAAAVRGGRPAHDLRFRLLLVMGWRVPPARGRVCCCWAWLGCSVMACCLRGDRAVVCLRAAFAFRLLGRASTVRPVLELR